MAMKIGEMLVARNAIDNEQLRKALQAQVIVGGKLGTNLIELGYADEDIVLESLAKQLGARPAKQLDLAAVPASTIRMLSEKVAGRYKIVPFRAADKVLHLAMINMNDLLVQDEVAFLTGHRVQPYIALEIRIMEALERYYSIKRPRRYVLIAGRLQRELQRQRTAAAIPEPIPASLPIPLIPIEQQEKPRQRPHPAAREIDLDELRRRQYEDYRLAETEPPQGKTQQGPPPPATALSTPASTLTVPSLPTAATLGLGTANQPATVPAPPEWNPPSARSRSLDEAMPFSPFRSSAPEINEGPALEIPAGEIYAADSDAAMSPWGGPWDEEQQHPGARFPIPQSIELEADDMESLGSRPQEAPASPAQASAPLAPAPVAETPELEPEIESESPVVEERQAADDEAAAEPVWVTAEPVEVAAEPVEVDIDEAARRLANVETRDDISDVLLDFAMRSFARVALFIPKNERVLGWNGRGGGLTQERVKEIIIPLNGPSIFLNLVGSTGYYLGPLPPMPLNLELARGLGGDAPRDLLLLPILLRQKAVAIIYADRGKESVASVNLTELRRVAVKAAIAFEVYILKNKLRLA